MTTRMGNKDAERGSETLRGFGAEVTNLIVASLVLSIIGGIAVFLGVQTYRDGDASTTHARLN
jgi:hypothetical protein